ncbi:MAG TPA: hypothetical protein VGQ77_04625 [Methylomirabilota bacterium]|jgi:hypothetical protein|nr:hypothetical protein [Methylomirabilota bacterium]
MTIGTVSALAAARCALVSARVRRDETDPSLHEGVDERHLEQ